MVAKRNISLSMTIIIILDFVLGSTRDQKVVGLSNEPVRLICDVSDSDQHSFSWTDKVYNEDNNPSLIYNSSIGKIESKYADKGFSVNENILFIQDEAQDASGHYFCEIYSINGTTLTVRYEVRIISEQSCSNNLEVVEGEIVLLQCNFTTSFSTNPFWVGDAHEIYTGEHHSEFRINMLTTRFKASWKHDGVIFRCMQEDLEICNNKLNVKYKVRGVDLPEENLIVYPGDNLTCQASGNPIPEVIATLHGTRYPNASGKGKASLQVKGDLIGKKITIRCEAWNELDGITARQTNESHVLVVEKPFEGQTYENAGSPFLIVIITAAIILLLLIIASVIILNKKRCKKDLNKPKAEATLLKAETRKDPKS